MEARVEELSGKLQEAQSDFDRVSSQLSKSNNLCKKLETSIVDLKETIEGKNVEISELSIRLKAVDDQMAEIDRLQSQVREKDAEIASLTGKLTEQENQIDVSVRDKEAYEIEKEALEASLEELDSQHQLALAHILASRDALAQENKQQKQQVEELEEKLKSAAQERAGEESKSSSKSDVPDSSNQDRNSAAKELAELRQRYEQAGLTLNELHMDKKELQETVNRCEAETKSLREQIGKAGQERRGLEQQVCQLEGAVEAKDAMIRMYKDQAADTGNGEVEKLKSELTESVQERDQLKTEMAELQVESTDLARQLQEASKLHKSAEEDKHQSELRVSEMESLIKSLRSQNGELTAKLHVANEERKHGQIITEQLQASAKETVQQKVEQEQGTQHSTDYGELSEKCRLQQGRIGDLESELAVLSTELQETKNLLRDSAQNQDESLKVKEAEVAGLRKEVESLSGKILELDKALDKRKEALQKSLDVEKQLQQVSEDNRNYVKEISNLKHQLSRQAVPDKNSGSFKLEDVTALKRLLEQKDAQIQAHEKQVETLQKKIASTDSEVGSLGENCQPDVQPSQSLPQVVHDLKQQLSLKQSENAQLIDELRSFKLKLGQSNGQVASNCDDTERASSKHNCDMVLQNGRLETDEDDESSIPPAKHKEELKKLKDVLEQKDSVIAQLNDTNSSLLKLVEQRSQSLFGDTSLLDLHQLRTEVRKLKAEKDQIMSVLNEKSRECSSLKGEVHRLMNVVSAEKTALTKLQQDNQELTTNRQHQQREHDEASKEMTKEAVKKLSQIIRDKDVEIEALQQKNFTLLQVLQDSSQDGSGEQISGLIQERDNLTKQVAAFQKDREQIITALNAKHQESIAYHGEIQRLTALMSSETEKKDKLQQEYSNLVQQFEDKQQALVKVQNELLNYKQKYAEMDKRFREISRSTSSPKSSYPHLSGGIANKSSIVSSASSNHSVPRSGPGSTVSDAADTEDSATTLNSITMAQEIQDLKSVIQSHEDAFTQHDKIVSDKQNAIRERDRKLLEKDQGLQVKEQKLADLHAKLTRVEESLRVKESELAASKKQCENVSFQLQGVETEFTDLKQERDQLYDRTSVLQQEIGAAKEVNNRLNMMIQDRDFELNALKEKTNTLTKMVQQHGEGEKGEMDRLMKETEAIQQQAQTFKQERDRGMLALQQEQTEKQQLQTEVKTETAARKYDSRSSKHTCFHKHTVRFSKILKCNF